MISGTLDDIDREILAALTADARVPLVAIAARVHLSRNAVKQRMERMERDGVIAGYTVVPGAAAARGVTAIVMVYRSDRMRDDRVIATLRGIPEVVRCDVLSGEYDLFGNPQYRDGDVLLDSVYRFKGQSAPCVILTEVDFGTLDERAARKLFVGATRATMKLIVVASQRAVRSLGQAAA